MWSGLGITDGNSAKRETERDTMDAIHVHLRAFQLSIGECHG